MTGVYSSSLSPVLLSCKNICHPGTNFQYKVIWIDSIESRYSLRCCKTSLAVLFVDILSETAHKIQCENSLCLI